MYIIVGLGCREPAELRPRVVASECRKDATRGQGFLNAAYSQYPNLTVLEHSAIT